MWPQLELEIVKGSDEKGILEYFVFGALIQELIYYNNQVKNTDLKSLAMFNGSTRPLLRITIMNITKFIKKIALHCYSTVVNPIVCKIKTKTTAIRFIYLVFISALIFMPITSSASVKNAASCSYSNVLAAYTSASAGDTVAIPASTLEPFSCNEIIFYLCQSDYRI